MNECFSVLHAAIESNLFDIAITEKVKNQAVATRTLANQFAFTVQGNKAQTTIEDCVADLVMFRSEQVKLQNFLA